MKDPYFVKYVEQIYSYFIATSHNSNTAQTADLYYKVPLFSSFQALLEYINDDSGRISLSQLDDKCDLNTAEILASTSFLELLKFVVIEDNMVILTAAGKMLLESNIQSRKKILAQHLMRHLPIIGYILDTLQQKSGHRVAKKRFLLVLEDKLSKADALDVLKAVTALGRYAELFSYDYKSQHYYL
jgi:NitT/TauT family transport system ATP-binding protein